MKLSQVRLYSTLSRTKEEVQPLPVSQPQPAAAE